MNTEQITEKIGGKGKYQFIISLLLLIAGMGNDFSVIYLSLQISPPVGNIKLPDGTYKFDVLSIDNCNLINNDKSRIDIDKDKSNMNMSYYFGIYCDPLKNTIVLLSISIGNLFGLINNTVFSMKRKEKLIFVYISLFVISCLFTYIKNIYSIYVMLLIQGFCHIPTFLLRSSIMTEMTSKDSRSFYMSMQILSGVLTGCITPFVYKSELYYVYSYTITSGIVLVVLVILAFLLVDSPRYLIINNQIEEAIKSATFIGRMNGKVYYENEVIDDNNFKISSEELKQWFHLTFSREDIIKLLDEDDYRIEETINENNEKEIEKNEILSKTKSNTLPSHIPYKKLILLILINISYTFILFLNVYEISIFSNEDYFEYYFTSSMIISGILLFLCGYLMNIKSLGRKGMIILLILYLALLRIFMFFGYTNTLKPVLIYLYFCQRPVSNSGQIPVTTLILESLSNQRRVFYFGIINILSKFVSFGIPFIVSYLNIVWSSVIYIVFCLFTLIICCFISESNQLDLIDYDKTEKKNSID